MSIFLAILLGLVQGLCEFLPVSSSGHLVLLQNIFGMEEGALFLDTMLHVGTLLAVLTVYRRAIWEMLCHPFQKKVGLLLLATGVTAALAFLTKDLIVDAYQGGLLGIGFLVTAAVLFLSERFFRAHEKTSYAIEGMKPLGAVGVGLMQAVAILPGISRSGSTIAGSRFFGLNSEAAAEFSFLLSIPAILGSVILQLPDVLEQGMGNLPWAPILVGMAVAGASGYFAIRWMLRILKTKSLTGFALYVGVLGILVLFDQLVTHVFF
ncbi:MAG: undecaprenyl-diphosphate phosphatase [Candidatus Pelethousia sp.]|nr:undecaprenyl-diphosphate phosphatase [Candidatus Pelethousia sp.]